MKPREAAPFHEPATQEASEYWGPQKYHCRVYNLTGYDLSEIKVTHKLGDTVDVGDNDGGHMYFGAWFAFDVTCGSGHSDYWDIWARPQGGHISDLERYGKKCDIESSDVWSGEMMLIVLNPRDVGWSVQLPRSSSCINNYYEYE